MQAAYSLGNGDTLLRELRGLHEACKYLNVENGMILTFDEEREMEYMDIRIQVILFYRYFLN